MPGPGHTADSVCSASWEAYRRPVTLEKGQAADARPGKA
jgi:hypothetical protein